MTDVRARRVREISDALGHRQLVWFGIRGEDAEPLLAIPQFTACFGITAPLEAAKLSETATLEQLTGHRVDLDTYDIDFDDRPVVHILREALLRALARPSAVTTYRPSAFLSDITFASSETATALGLFKDRQVAFEHKPWVETQLRDLGIRTIPWQYVPTERRRRVAVGEGYPPVVLRPSRTSGGVGISVVSNQDELEAAWDGGSGQLMGVAPFFAEAVPLNVNACAFGNDVVTVHPASVQLIGIDGLTNRRFGFCGNDFAAVREVSVAALNEIDATTRTIGSWLGAMGYRGAFGVDYLLDGDTLYFAEVNARMQGSSRIASALAARAGHVDLLLDHLAAFIGLPPAEARTVTDWVAELPPSAQLIKHHLGAIPATTDALHLMALPRDARIALAPQQGVRIEPGGVSWCLEVSRQVTDTGFELVGPDLQNLIHAVQRDSVASSSPVAPHR